MGARCAVQRMPRVSCSWAWWRSAERYGNNATYSQRSGTENATCELFRSLVEKCAEISEQCHVQSEIRYRECHVWAVPEPGGEVCRDMGTMPRTVRDQVQRMPCVSCSWPWWRSVQRYGNNDTYSQRSGPENAMCELFLCLVEKCAAVQRYVNNATYSQRSGTEKATWPKCFLWLVSLRPHYSAHCKCKFFKLVNMHFSRNQRCPVQRQISQSHSTLYRK